MWYNTTTLAPTHNRTFTLRVPLVATNEWAIYTTTMAEHLNGTVDEVRIYNRVLSQKEILDDYIATSKHYYSWRRRLVSRICWLLKYKRHLRKMRQDYLMLLAKGGRKI